MKDTSLKSRMIRRTLGIIGLTSSFISSAFAATMRPWHVMVVVSPDTCTS